MTRFLQIFAKSYLVPYLRKFEFSSRSKTNYIAFLTQKNLTSFTVNLEKQNCKKSNNSVIRMKNIYTVRQLLQSATHPH